MSLATEQEPFRPGIGQEQGGEQIPTWESIASHPSFIYLPREKQLAIARGYARQYILSNPFFQSKSDAEKMAILRGFAKPLGVSPEFLMSTGPISEALKYTEDTGLLDKIRQPLVRLEAGLKPPAEASKEEIMTLYRFFKPETVAAAGMSPAGALVTTMMTAANQETHDPRELITARIMYGAAYGTLEAISSFTSPENVGLMVGTVGLGALAKRGIHIARLGGSAASLVFSYLAGKEIPEQFKQLGFLIDEAKEDPKLWGEVGRAFAHLVVSGSVSAGAAKHGVKELKQFLRATAASRYAKIAEQAHIASELPEIIQEQVEAGKKVTELPAPELRRERKGEPPDLLKRVEQWEEAVAAIDEQAARIREHFEKNAQLPPEAVQSVFADDLSRIPTSRLVKQVENLYRLGVHEPDRLIETYVPKEEQFRLTKKPKVFDGFKETWPEGVDPDAYVKILYSKKPGAKTFSAVIGERAEMQPPVSTFYGKMRALEEIIGPDRVNELRNMSTTELYAAFEKEYPKVRWKTLGNRYELLEQYADRKIADAGIDLLEIRKDPDSPATKTIVYNPKAVERVKPDAPARFRALFAEMDRRAYIERGHRLAAAFREMNIEKLEKYLDKTAQYWLNGKKLPSRVAYDDLYDLVYDETTGTFKKERLRPYKDQEWRKIYNSLIYEVARKWKTDPEGNLPSDAKTWARNILQDATDGNLYRLSKEELLFLQKRVRSAPRTITDDQIVSLLRSGEVPEIFDDPSVIRLAKLPDDVRKAIFAIEAYGLVSPHTFLMKAGLENVVRTYYRMEHAREMLNARWVDKVVRFAWDPVFQIKNKAKRDAIARKIMQAQLDLEEGVITLDDIKDPIVKTVITRMQDGLREIAAEAQAANLTIRNPATGSIRPWSPKDNYFPHIFEPRTLDMLEKRVDRIALQVAKRYDVDLFKARSMVQNWISSIRSSSYGPLEVERLFDVPGWLGDPRRADFKFDHVIEALSRYVTNAARRITWRQWMEGQIAGGVDAVRAVAAIEDPILRRYAFRALQELEGKRPPGWLQWLEQTALRPIRNLQVFRKMGMSTLLNATQTLIGTIPKAAELGFVNTIRDAIKVMRELKGRIASEKLARELAIDVENAMEAALGITGSGWTGKIAKATLRANFFQKVELFNRIFAAYMGRMYVKRALDYIHGRDVGAWADYFRQYRKEDLIRELRKLGLSEKAIKTGKFDVFGGKTYQINELAHAMYMFSRMTQFRARPVDVPIFWNSPIGRLIFQFKTFAFSQARLVWHNFMKPVLRNPADPRAWVPLLAWVTGSQIAGEAAYHSRWWIYQNILGMEKTREPDYWPERFIVNLATAGPASLFYDLYLGTVVYGELYGSLLGPTGQDIGDAFEAVVTASRTGNIAPLARVTLPAPFGRAAEQWIWENR